MTDEKKEKRVFGRFMGEGVQPVPVGRIWTESMVDKPMPERLASPFDRYVVTTYGDVGSLIYNETPTDPDIRWLRTDHSMGVKLNKQKSLRLFAKAPSKQKALDVTATTLVVQYFIYPFYMPKAKLHYIRHIDGDINNNHVLNLRVYKIKDRKHFLRMNTKVKSGILKCPIHCTTTGKNYASTLSVLKDHPKISRYVLMKNLCGVTKDIDGLNFRRIV